MKNIEKKFNISVRMNSEVKYEVTYKFQEQSDYDSFIEAQTEYPKLRRFCEEFEMQLRNWRKHGSVPEPLTGLIASEELSKLMSHEIEKWYYATKEEWGDV